VNYVTLLRSSLFCHVMQRRLVVTDVSGQTQKRRKLPIYAA